MKTPDSYGTPEQRIKDIINLYGLDILTSKSRLTSLIRDMYAKDIKVRNLLLTSIQAGIPVKLLDLRGIDEKAREGQIHYIADRFSDDFTIPREAVYHPINIFTYILGYGTYCPPLSIPEAETQADPIQEPASPLTEPGSEMETIAGIVRTLLQSDI